MISEQQFYAKLKKHLVKDDIKDICQLLDLDYENLLGETKNTKLQSLLKKASPEQILPIIQDSHPLVDWLNTQHKPSALTPRERGILLDRVQNGRIKPALENWQERVKLELRLESDFNLYGHVADRKSVEFGKEIGEIFDETGRQLLILGEPGSGKTTTLLMLAEDLLGRAKADASEPIPLILNLSTWTIFNPTVPASRKKWWQIWKQEVNTTDQKPFERWLGQACFQQYTLDPSVTQTMLENGELVLLLDALDEVGSEKMEACLQAINEVGLNEVVVSSRIKDYSKIETNLNVMIGVQILPLTDGQISDYFKTEDGRFDQLKTVVNTDPELKELARTPLMLSVMALAFEEASEAQLASLQNQLDKVDFIFNKYIDRMFFRRPLYDQEWNEAQSRRWLIYLASALTEHNQTFVTLENIQPSWIPTKRGVFSYRISAMTMLGLLSGVLIGLPVGVQFGRIDAIWTGLSNGVRIALIVGLFSALFFRSIIIRKIKITEKTFWSFPSKSHFFSLITDVTHLIRNKSSLPLENPS